MMIYAMSQLTSRHDLAIGLIVQPASTLCQSAVQASEGIYIKLPQPRRAQLLPLKKACPELSA
jgi:hypothetical protein